MERLTNNGILMKKHLPALATVVLSLALLPALGQPAGRGAGGMRGGPRGPEMGGAMTKLFGENTAFSATMVMESSEMRNGAMTGKMSCDNGKSRFEINLGENNTMPAPDAARMKSMGMDQIVIISRPDKMMHYMVYPGLQAYAETAVPASDATKPATDFKVETTELGKETVDGHPCVKNKVVVTDDQGKKFESTVWNATDLKKFPVKIETTQEGHKMTLAFKDVKLAKPDAAQFEPPADMKKYDSMMSLMQEEMMKRMGGMGARPPQNQ
jgi:hypothetical protein